MEIKEIQTLYSALPQIGALDKLLEERQKSIYLKGLAASAAPLLFSALDKRRHETIIFVLQDADEAGYFYHDLTQIMGEKNVLFFPSAYRRAVKYGQKDSANEILRTEVLSRVTSNTDGSLYIVTCPEAVSELVVSRTRLNENTISLSEGDEVEVSSIAVRLRTLGFHETDYVYEPGQFALRGSILDIYSYSCEYPFRIDFFGDEVDTIRTFTIETQLSGERRKHIEIVPELTNDKESKVSFLSLLPESAIIAVHDRNFVEQRVGKIYEEGFTQQAYTERMAGATEAEQAEIMRAMKKESTLVARPVFESQLSAFSLIEFGSQTAGMPGAVIDFDISPQPLFHKNFDIIRQSFTEYIINGYRIYILADSAKQNERLKAIFDDMENENSVISFIPVDKTLHEGFADNTLKACFFTDHQIFDRFHKYSLRSDKARSGKMALTLKEIQEMKPGDFIVHIDFGIGMFGGLLRVQDGNKIQEKIRIIFQHNDIVDVSIHALYKVSKYRSATAGEKPKLSILGSGAWERMKQKAKEKIKDIARDLIRLYAKRSQEKGFAFSHDSFMQHELEASFLYEDTPDQLKATNDVKADMESDKPMDRLVCGDVGFGKTEVAVRAAFKAACDNKQVAVLVPTTVLAYQHFHTFSKRLKDFPVKVDYLSRARSTAQTHRVTDGLASGDINIIIGTQKILSKSIKFKDLGLLIIDEEQKFGVAVKEKLRKIKTNIDTLTMSATPIPRTLQFSLMGARDMSIIRTAPPNRHPVQTMVTTFGAEVIAEAINFEMSRNGQVYFVNDRIASLQDIKEIILRNVPDARVAIGHGQMKPADLEDIIFGFMNHDYDVLLSTTIVENGVDIPNANTIIINDAHHFGLSDLHQMRGRVGRGNRKAFCYLLAPPKSYLPDESRRRLEAIETFSDLGSGFNISMQDLDIRGAGNLLGSEQSGFMESLGYETYKKILKQAVSELKNDEFKDLYEERIEKGDEISGDEFVDDCTIESDLEMYFPDSYVPGSAERMLLYRELDNIEDDDAMEAYRRRLIDRFGPVPKEGEELMHVVPLRRLAKKLGCEKLMLKGGKLTMLFISKEDSAFFQTQMFGNVIRYVSRYPKDKEFRPQGKRSLAINNVNTTAEAVKIMRDIINIQPAQ